jgi:hypothetical protein
MPDDHVDDFVTRLAQLDARVRRLEVAATLVPATRRSAIAAAVAARARGLDEVGNRSLLGRVRAHRASLGKAPEHPWLKVLREVQGREYIEGVRTIGTRQLMDQLGVPPTARTSTTYRTLVSLMSALGWRPTRVYLQSGKLSERVRGFRRGHELDTRPQPLPAGRL